MKAEQLAKLFHETYASLAPSFGLNSGYKPWEDESTNYKKLMVTVTERVLLTLNEGMTSKEYSELALRTETTLDPLKIPYASQLLHSALGCGDESGEIIKLIKDNLFYGKSLCINDLEEEYGDLLWFIALGLAAIKSSFTEAMELNIAKLRARYPDKFTEDKAINRELDKERKALTTSPPDTFITVSQVNVPKDATITCNLELYYAVMTGRLKGEIVHIDDKYVLREQE